MQQHIGLCSTTVSSRKVLLLSIKVTIYSLRHEVVKLFMIHHQFIIIRSPQRDMQKKCPPGVQCTVYHLIIIIIFVCYISRES